MNQTRVVCFQACLLAALIFLRGNADSSNAVALAASQSQQVPNPACLDKSLVPEHVVDGHVLPIDYESQLHNVVHHAGASLFQIGYMLTEGVARHPGNNTATRDEFNSQHSAPAARHVVNSKVRLTKSHPEHAKTLIQSTKAKLKSGRARKRQARLHDESSYSISSRCLTNAINDMALGLSSELSAWSVPPMLETVLFLDGTQSQSTVGKLDSSLSPSFKAIVLIALYIFAAMVWHEFAVYYGCEPLLASWGLRKLRPLQAVFCLTSMEIFKQGMVLVSVSYDLATELGYGVTASAFILCAGGVTFPIGAGMAKKAIGDGSDWQQPKLRRKIILMFSFMTLNDVLAGFLSSATALSNDVKFWSLLANRALWGFFNGNVFLTLNVMAMRAVPPSERTVFGLCNVSAKNLGLLAGPLVASIAMMISGTTEAPATEQAVPVVLLDAAFTVITLCLLSLLLPTDFQQVEDVEEQISNSLFVPDQQELGPEKMPDEMRRKTVYLMGWYNIERSITTTAIEVCSVLIFEMEYAMRPTTCGVLLSLAGACSAGVCVLFSFFLSRGMIQESTIIGLAAASSLLGGVLLFNVGGSFTLVLADVLLYSFCSLGGGACEGWASRAAKEGSDFNQGVFRSFMATGISLARLLVPPVSRSIVGAGGRNVYAAAQFSIILAGCYTILKAFWLHREFLSHHCHARQKWTTETIRETSSKTNPEGPPSYSVGCEAQDPCCQTNPETAPESFLAAIENEDCSRDVITDESGAWTGNYTPPDI